MQVFKGKTFADVYQLALAKLMASGRKNEARGTSSIELRDIGLEIKNPEMCLYSNSKRSSQLKYLAAEFLWYYSGRNDAAFIGRFAKMWESIKSPDGTVNSAYGFLLFTDRRTNDRNQYEWAYSSLALDPHTRQAIMHFNNESHQYFDNKDFVCTMYGNFHIRDNKLHLSIFMRSNDAILGTPTDIPFFCSLQLHMLKHLRDNFIPDLELGTYTHLANSFHVYERHYDLVQSMLAEPFQPVQIPPIKTDLIKNDGSPTVELLDLMKEVETPTKRKVFMQEENDLLSWMWTKLIPERLKTKEIEQAVKV